MLWPRSLSKYNFRHMRSIDDLVQPVDGVKGELGADTDPFLLHLFAALAERERRIIGERTRVALQAARRAASSLVAPMRSRSPIAMMPTGAPHSCGQLHALTVIRLRKRLPHKKHQLSILPILAPVFWGDSFASSAQFWRLSAPFALYLGGCLYGTHIGAIGTSIVPKVLAQYRTEQLVGSIPYVLAVGTELHFGRTIGALRFHRGDHVDSVDAALAVEMIEEACAAAMRTVRVLVDVRPLIGGGG